MVSSDTPAKIGFVIWLVVGLVIYFGYSTRHSKVQKLLASEQAPLIDEERSAGSGKLACCTAEAS